MREPNPPGRTELEYRIGTWSTFRARMLAALPDQVVPPGGGSDGARPLAALTTRSTQDATIALVDAFAAACDVLTFYTERIAGETYLATAIEEWSVTEIARATGYEPAPGVAATVDLAFTVEDGHADAVLIPRGHAVLSVPVAQDELPVTFETTGALEARAEWNVLRPRRTAPRGPLQRGDTTLYLAGLATRLSAGDPIVVLGQGRRDAAPGTADVGERWDLRTVAEVTPDPAYGHTVVTLDRGLGDQRTEPAEGEVTVLTFTGSGGLFGAAAPDARFVSAEIKNLVPPVEQNGQWVGFALADDPLRKSAGKRVLDLDREHPSVVRGGWVCLVAPGVVELYRVSHAGPAARADFSLAGRVTRVLVDSPEHLDLFPRRGTAVLLGSRVLPTADPPDASTVSGTEIELHVAPATALPAGRALLVTGTAVQNGEPVVLRATAEAPEPDRPRRLRIDAELPELERSTVAVLANVAAATHGETVPPAIGPPGNLPAEVLGSGDAGAGGQRFRMRQHPLTWVPAAPDGARPELEITVNGVVWTRVATLFTAGPRDRVYTLRREHDGATTVAFGDGVRGARLPSGVENVRARYRTGIGRPGIVAAGQLALLRDRPPGLRGVTNPAASSGAAVPDDLQQIRRLSPRTVLTLDRLVSLQDYEDHAAGFPGIGKARAVDLWDGQRGVVHLTVAGPDGARLDRMHPTVATLLASIDALRDPAHHPFVDGHDEHPFTVALRVLAADRQDEPAVLAAVRTALAAAFAFPVRGFGQPVTAAEVISAAQRVPGVVAVDLDALHGPDGPAVRGVLAAPLPRWDGTRPTRAALLVLDLDASDVTPWETA